MSTASIEAQQRTRAFARVLGPYIAIFTIVYAIRLPELSGLTGDLFAQPTMTVMLAALMIAGGLVIIGLHRSCRGPLAITVSLFGWFVAIRGVLLFAAPELVRSGVDATMLSPAATTRMMECLNSSAMSTVMIWPKIAWKTLWSSGSSRPYMASSTTSLARSQMATTMMTAMSQESTKATTCSNRS